SELEFQGWLARWFDDRRREGSSWLVSLAVHLSLLALLGTIFFHHDARDGFFGTVLTRGEVGSPDGAIDGAVIAADLVAPVVGDPQDRAIAGAEAVSRSVHREIPRVVLPGPGLPAGGSAIDPEPDDEPEAGALNGPAGSEKTAKTTGRKTGT